MKGRGRQVKKRVTDPLVHNSHCPTSVNPTVSVTTLTSTILFFGSSFVLTTVKEKKKVKEKERRGGGKEGRRGKDKELKFFL